MQHEQLVRTAVRVHAMLCAHPEVLAVTTMGAAEPSPLLMVRC